MVKIYKQPFAHDGDAIAIPDASQPDGKMSSADGWTPDYQLPKTDPNYKPVGRQEMNGVFKEITESLGEIQQFGFAKWQPMQWPQGARVVEGGVVYRALTQTSQQPPHADWVDDAVGGRWSLTYLDTETSWYVNANSGNDLNDGLTPSTAFKTIDRAVSNVADNFYLAGVTAIINVASGSYDEDLKLSNIMSRNGRLKILGAGQEATIINGTITDNNATSVVELANMTVAARLPGQYYVVFAQGNKDLQTSNVTVNSGVTYTGGGIKALLLSYGGVVSVLNGCSFNATPGTGINSIWFSTGAGEISFRENASFSGAPIGSAVTALSNGIISRDPTVMPVITGSLTSGARYNVSSGGQIVTYGGGPNFFPGTAAGTSSSGGYYS